MLHPDKTAGVGHVLHASDCGLGAQRISGLQRELEAWIMAQLMRIVTVFITSRDHHGPELNDIFQEMACFGRITRIVETRSK